MAIAAKAAEWLAIAEKACGFDAMALNALPRNLAITVSEAIKANKFAAGGDAGAKQGDSKASDGKASEPQASEAKSSEPASEAVPATIPEAGPDAAQ